MIAQIVRGPGEDGTMYTGSARAYARDGEQVGRGMAGEQGMESAKDQRSLDDLTTKYDVAGKPMGRTVT